MSGSELDDQVEDQESLKEAALDHFNPSTEIQDEDEDTPELEDEAPGLEETEEV
jgi:hypothetical protein